MGWGAVGGEISQQQSENSNQGSVLHERKMHQPQLLEEVTLILAAPIKATLSNGNHLHATSPSKAGPDPGGGGGAAAKMA